MSDWSLVTRSHVMAALAEHDRLDAREFHRRYGIPRSKAHTMWHHGNEYDPVAVLGVAHLHATGRVATAADVGGEQAAARVLTGLGFDVVVDDEALEALERAQAKAPARRTTSRSAGAPRPPARSSTPRSAPTRRPAKQEVAPKICPTCYTALPATGRCDFCE